MLLALCLISRLTGMFGVITLFNIHTGCVCMCTSACIHNNLPFRIVVQQQTHSFSRYLCFSVCVYFSLSLFSFTLLLPTPRLSLLYSHQSPVITQLYISLCFTISSSNMSIAHITRKGMPHIQYLSYQPTTLIRRPPLLFQRITIFVSGGFDAIPDRCKPEGCCKHRDG
jgi:hypothetical protein